MRMVLHPSQSLQRRQKIQPNMVKVVTVFGATGSQGSSVIYSILGHPSLSYDYKIRGVSRNVTSDEAKNLIGKGIDMVQVCWKYRKGNRRLNFFPPRRT